MNQFDKAISESLQYDPLRKAEEITGERYGKETDALGFYLLQQRSQDRDALFELTDDTKFSDDFDRYMRIARSLGFEVVYIEPFKREDGRDDTFYVMYRKPGIILEFDTYTTDRISVNGGNFYYCWKPHKGTNDFYNESSKDKAHVTSSGCWYANPDDPKNDEALIWAGDHDCREGLRFHIKQLEHYGSFIEPWCVPMWFHLNYGNDYNMTKHIEERDGFKARYAVTDELSLARIKKLPQRVQEVVAITLQPRK